MKSSLTALLATKHAIPVFLSDDCAKSHYDGYSKSTLWPLLHYQLWDKATDGRVEHANWEDYLAVNQAFADIAISIYQDGDIVWIHDYHLFATPALVRSALPEAAIGFFLHAPFPSSEIFRCLPKRREVLEGVLGANLVGFQIYSYARHFISSCTRVLGCESSPTGIHHRGFAVSVGAFPIGIDVDKVRAFRGRDEVEKKKSAIRDLFPGKKIVLGRDHLDPTKGVVQKLQAFERFLHRYPAWRDRVVLVQVTTARHEHPKLEQRIAEVVARINGSFGSITSVPVHYYNQALDRAEFYALLELADIALITSTRDGMNTTSYEWVMCQERGGHGPLILSEFTGTAGSLSGAIHVNPWDVDGVAQSIHDALTLAPEDRDVKYRQLHEHVTACTSTYWAQSFVREIRATMQLPDRSSSTPYLDIEACISSYAQVPKGSGRRLLMFDYDGTLTPIVTTPEAALPSPEMLKALRSLCADRTNRVWIISGRDQTFLETHLGTIPGLGLSAEHGCFMRYPSTMSKEGTEEEAPWINLTEGMDFTWMEEIKRIFDYYTERTQGSFVEVKQCSVTWHYRKADPAYGEFQANECQNHLENAVLSKLPIEILVGKKNLEVRPIALNKGEIVRRLVQEETTHSSSSSLQWLMCAGDDKTDEDMFRALRKDKAAPKDRDWTVTIGEQEKRTLARWHVRQPEQLISLLGQLAATREDS
ncbi:glycosyltransferase family 20-domain-containing protein [Piptocephalis cylindrospora]|uniref:Glycosyltransferase family 20-domain-containing protein n=1 Tax=Piptocephalis cylindrospora TaxID=1907219 RepID=A0A4P9Y1S6_9FUNG|nr:glycosyltransferase family 20-domain-containing protein [Piptocephalis cylindrospora]|eukprot:RKP12614.1 glycosyltransferase family 20-domain-containing protein [Piptocephalis cylindrospora]